MRTAESKAKIETTQTALTYLNYSQILKNLGTNIIADNTTKTATFCCNAQTNLYYFSQRYYDPEAHQFTSKDPAKSDGEENAYQYCGGEPVNYIDLLGMYKVKRYWWGIRISLSHKEAQKAASSLWFASVIFALLLDSIASIGPAYIAWGCSYYDDGNGVYIYQSWAGTVWFGSR